MTLLNGFSDADLSACTQELLWWAKSRFSAHDAEEVVQETLLRAHKARGTFISGQPLMVWLYQIIRNVAADRWRTQLRMQRIYAAVVSQSVVCDLEVGDGSLDLEQKDAVTQLLGALSEVQRTMMVLVALCGLSYQEAATMLCVPVVTVRSRLFSAKSLLRAQLAADFEPQLEPQLEAPLFEPGLVQEPGEF